jgi:hypothetical protein
LSKPWIFHSVAYSLFGLHCPKSFSGSSLKLGLTSLVNLLTPKQGTTEDD